MTYRVLIRIDGSRESVAIRRDDSPPLEGEEGVRFRLVAETDNEIDAVKIADRAWRRLNGRLVASMDHSLRPTGAPGGPDTG